MAKKRKAKKTPSTEQKLADTDWKYVPIRRLFVFLEDSLYKATKWLVYEPKETKKERKRNNPKSLSRYGAFSFFERDHAAHPTRPQHQGSRGPTLCGASGQEANRATTLGSESQ